jgi:hypothetical protein
MKVTFELEPLQINRIKIFNSKLNEWNCLRETGLRPYLHCERLKNDIVEHQMCLLIVRIYELRCRGRELVNRFNLAANNSLAILFY